MLLPAFNNEVLKKRLVKLDKKQQFAFGAICCERLLPNYIAFKKDTGWGDIIPIREALNFVWMSVENFENKIIDIEELKNITASCESTAPDSETFESLYTSLAQDACFAVCGLLDCLLKYDVDKIVQVAMYATDSVDLYVQEITNIIPSDPDLEQKILNHHLMQRELLQQEKNLDQIEQTTSPDLVFLGKLKQSWDNQGKSNLDLP